jgi:mycofactocin precursor
MAAMATTTHPDSPAPTADPRHEEAPTGDPEGALVEEDLLVEEISIDGMCGVY